LQQRGVEMPDVAAVGGGAFGKQGDMVAVAQCAFDLLVGASGVAAAGALDEQGAGLLRQETDQRPTTYFGLGNEAQREHRIQQINVEPGNVVGGKQNPFSATLRDDAPHRQADRQYRQEFCRPASG